MKSLADKLELAAVKFDARIFKRHVRNPFKVYHNPHALGLYRARIVQVLDDVARGASPREAIVAGFEGTLRQHMLRACGFPADWSNGPSLTYRPVTQDREMENKTDHLRRMRLRRKFRASLKRKSLQKP